MKNSERLLQSISLRAGRFVFLVPLLVASQEAPLTIRTDTRAVQVDVAVRDEHGAPVRQLTKDDFTLLDNGKPRAIAFFSAVAGEPAGEPGAGAVPPGTPSTSLTAGPSAEASPSHVFSNTAPSNAPRESVTVILLDASSPTLDTTTGATGIGDLVRARKGVADAMAKLPMTERIAIYHISPAGLKIIQSFTADRDLLRKSINAWTVPVDWKPNCGRSDAPNHIGPGMDRHGPNTPDPLSFACSTAGAASIRVGAISALDSLRVIGEKLAGLPGRKNLIWVTPGFPPALIVPATRESLDDTSKHVIAQLNDANVELNAIDVRGAGGGIKGQVEVMQTLTEATGGKAYLTRNDIGAAIQEVDEAAHTNYTLGFYLADSERDGKFHKLELRVDHPKLSLSYRQGYFAGDSPNSKPSKEAPETELLDPVEATAIGISATAGVTPGVPHPTLHLTMLLDGRNLTLVSRNKGEAYQVSRMVAELDARGATLVEAQDSREFAVPTKSLDTIHNNGIRLHWDQTLPLMMGATKVRVIVRDKATGLAGTLTVPVTNAQ